MTLPDTIENVTCPWCATSFDVVPTTSASGFKCPHCGRDSSLGALRNPDHRPNALEIAEASSQASTHNLYRHTAAYVYEDQRGDECVGSGTLVQIGAKFLLATVAHTIPRNLKSLWLVKKAGMISPVRIDCVTRRCITGDDRIDVGIFELATNAPTLVGLEPIGIDRIADVGTGSPILKARLIGYPRDYIRQNFPYRGGKGFYALSYGCEPIEPSRWPAITTIPKTFDDSIHVVVEFSDDIIDHSPDVPVPTGRPEPFGMSGGGLWQRKRQAEETELWKPDDLCLIAIQSAWLSEKSFLKAIQIIHWLKLVADEYAELRGELIGKFPRIEQITW